MIFINSVYKYIKSQKSLNKSIFHFLPLLHPILLIPPIKLIIAPPQTLIILHSPLHPTSFQTSTHLQRWIIINIIKIFFNCYFLLPTSLFTCSNLLYFIYHWLFMEGLLEMWFVTRLDTFVLADQDLGEILYFCFVYACCQEF